MSLIFKLLHNNKKCLIWKKIYGCDYKKKECSNMRWFYFFRLPWYNFFRFRLWVSFDTNLLIQIWRSKPENRIMGHSKAENGESFFHFKSNGIISKCNRYFNSCSFNLSTIINYFWQRKPLSRQKWRFSISKGVFKWNISLNEVLC